MSKEINLQQILDTTCTLKNHHGKLILTEEEVFLAMKEACRQALELASENAKIFHEYYDKYDNYKKYCEFAGTFTERCDGDGIPYGVDVYDVNRKSILETINQIK